MNVSATNLDGQAVRYVDCTVNGSNIYLIKIDSSNNLTADVVFLSGSNTLIATSATAATNS